MLPLKISLLIQITVYSILDYTMAFVLNTQLQLFSFQSTISYIFLSEVRFSITINQIHTKYIEIIVITMYSLYTLIN